jgi:hypothetical protein
MRGRTEGGADLASVVDSTTTEVVDTEVSGVVDITEGVLMTIQDLVDSEDLVGVVIVDLDEVVSISVREVPLAVHHAILGRSHKRASRLTNSQKWLAKIPSRRVIPEVQAASGFR